MRKWSGAFKLLQNKTHTRLSILTTAAKNVDNISVIRPAIPSSDGSEVNVLEKLKIEIAKIANAYIENITRLREDMDFMFEWQEQYLTSERSARLTDSSSEDRGLGVPD